MRLLDRYLGRVVRGAIGINVAVLLCLFTLFEFIERLKDLGRGGYDLSGVAISVAARIPRLCYELFPLAALVGALLGLGLLGRSGELAVIRCAGMSRLAITWAMLRTGLPLVVSAMLLGEFVAPLTERYANDYRTASLSSVEPSSRDMGLWLRDGDNYVNIQRIIGEATIGDVLIHEFDSDRQLRTTTHAGEAVFDGERWRLRDVARTSFDGDRVIATERPAEAIWNAHLRPELLRVVMYPPELQSLFALARYISYLRANGQDAERYRYAFWGKLVYPLSIAVMVLLAVPLVLRQGARHGGPGRYLIAGALLGIAFHLGNRVSVNFGIVADVPPLLGATGPTLLVATGALLLLRRTG